MIETKDLQELALCAAKFWREAHEQGCSMATVELDPVKLFSLPGEYAKDAGRMLIAIAIGPSLPTLKVAIEMAQNPH